jgi:hypothetical protein
MKRILPIALFLFLLSCNNDKPQTKAPVLQSSQEQQKLYQLYGRFNAEYSQTPNDIIKGEIIEAYQNRIDKYLRDTCKKKLFRLFVRVYDIQNDAVTTETVLRDSLNTYTFSYVYGPTEEKEKDSTYQFIRTLIPDRELYINFSVDKAKLKESGILFTGRPSGGNNISFH